MIVMSEEANIRLSDNSQIVNKNGNIRGGGQYQVPSNNIIDIHKMGVVNLTSNCNFHGAGSIKNKV